MIALRLLPIVIVFAVQQDEFPAWIEQLGHESIEVRDQAMRRLGALKASDIPRLEKARDAAADAGVRSRIAAIIEHIRASAELGKVLSPTRRYTKSGKGLKFSEVIRDLATLVEDKVTYDSEEEERTVDLDLANVTWWEALDRTMEAAGLRYWFTGRRDKRPKLNWTAKRTVPMPVAYLEQFRIAVYDARRYEFREPGRRSDVGLVNVQVWHQPDLRPERGWFHDAVKIESIKDAKGEEAMTESPDWNRGMSWNTSSVSADLAHQSYAWVRPDAALPLAIKGTATINFAKNTRETVIDLAGAERKVVHGAVTISVVSFTQSRAASKLKLRAETKEADVDLDRIVDDIVHVEDAEGKRHKGGQRGSTRAGEYSEWEFELPADIKDPKRVVLQWIAEYHKVEIPFRLEGVRLP
ncbi:MAG TPA: hypothetical protein VJU16_09480 [Planctomycetota bacterium]|nr:hypothetical protein [Planctomycetota bacterium]